MRLQKYLAHCGIASRRKSEKLIEEGFVKVNGKIIKEMGYKVKIGYDQVICNGEVVSLEKKHVYILLNKPKGVITSADDQFNRKTVLDFVTVNYRIYPVGRLDFETSGLILLTNDGDFANRMTHPRYKISKTYHAVVHGVPGNRAIQAFQKGILIDGHYTQPATLRVLRSGENSLLEIIITEGRNRQVRRMCDAVGHPIVDLRRVAIGKVELGTLKEGEWRYLSEEELEELSNKEW